MSITKQYFHDHFVLLLLSINAFLAVGGSLLVLLRISSSSGSSYIVQYRSISGINDFQTGSITDLLSFVAFAILIMGITSVLSLKAYKIHRQLAIFILSLGILLLALMIIISNALLVLR